jgi:hypothetical protein
LFLFKNKFLQPAWQASLNNPIRAPIHESQQQRLWQIYTLNTAMSAGYIHKKPGCLSRVI